MFVLIDPDHFDPRDLMDPFSPYFLVLWERTGDPPPPPTLPATRRRTRVKRSSWSLRDWLNTDLERGMP